MYRVGLGYDIHKLTTGRDLIIGGVKITHEKGLFGHSDADVLIHAIIDGMLGALALCDIGTLFPDTDPLYKDADSTLLLKHVYDLVLQHGYVINNLDCNIVAQKPKMMPYIPKMKEVIAKTLELEIENISIKAKTKEKLDAVGEKLAIESNAAVLLEKERNCERNNRHQQLKAAIKTLLPEQRQRNAPATMVRTSDDGRDAAVRAAIFERAQRCVRICDPAFSFRKNSKKIVFEHLTRKCTCCIMKKIRCS